MLADILFRARALFRPGAVERELDDELRGHLERATDNYVAAGMSRPDALRRARLELGGVAQVKEECRDARGTRGLEEIGRDLRYAVRMLVRSPGFTTMAVASLALGIGANTAIFTLIDAVMLRPLPVRAPGELVAVGDPSRPTAVWEGAPMVDVLSYPLSQHLRDRTRTLTGLLASGRSGRLEMSAVDGAAEPVRGRMVSGNYFDVLGVQPSIGRPFSPGEDRAAGASPVIVISDAFWTVRFARSPSVLGRTVRLNGSPFTIVSVGPPDFTGEVVGSPADVWIPIAMQPQLHAGPSRLERRESNWLLGLGRLAPGASIEAARAESPCWRSRRWPTSPAPR